MAFDEPVLLLHGFPQDHREWDLVRPILEAAGLRTVAPDQRGYSPVVRPADVAGYRPALLAADAVALMDGPFHLVGHDWGAVVAWQVAATFPERVRSLTALSVPHVGALASALRDDAGQREMFRYQDMLIAPGGDDTVLEWMSRALAPLGDRAALYLDAMRDDPGRLTGARNWYRACPTFEAWALSLTKVPVPTTFVWSDRDGAVSRTAAGRCGDWVTGDYHYIEMTGRSHWLPEEAPEEVAAAIVGAVRHCSEPKTS
jgi:pimeloyl-ACP methyl ester carboxylesterase